MTLLNISGLSHHYAHGGFNGKHQHQAVLNNVSLTLKSGETVALLGRSGCGKSTLARLLVGLESPAQGNISWRGEPLAKLNPVTCYQLPDLTLINIFNRGVACIKIQ